MVDKVEGLQRGALRQDIGDQADAILAAAEFNPKQAILDLEEKRDQLNLSHKVQISYSSLNLLDLLRICMIQGFSHIQ